MITSSTAASPPRRRCSTIRPPSPVRLATSRREDDAWGLRSRARRGGGVGVWEPGCASDGVCSDGAVGTYREPTTLVTGLVNLTISSASADINHSSGVRLGARRARRLSRMGVARRPARRVLPLMGGPGVEAARSGAASGSKAPLTGPAGTRRRAWSGAWWDLDGSRGASSWMTRAPSEPTFAPCGAHDAVIHRARSTAATRSSTTRRAPAPARARAHRRRARTRLNMVPRSC